MSTAAVYATDMTPRRDDAAPAIRVDRPAPGVRRFTIPLAFASPDHLHVHVLATPDGDVVVDTGLVGSEAALQAGLAAAGAEPAHVLLTHGHVDHWGLATTLAADVLAHPGVIPSIEWDAATADETPYGPGAPTMTEMRTVFGWMSGLAAGQPRVRPLADGDQVGDWEVVATPGHDPGHICLFRAADGVLLCGDLLLPGFTPNVQPTFEGTDALAEFLASLERVAALDVRLVLPAHGEPYRDHRRRARELAAHHARRLDALRADLAAGPRTLGESRSAVFGDAFTLEADRLLADLETYAHLDHLRRRGVVAFADGGWTLED